MPRNLSDSFFGSIALKNKYLTRDQLTQALRVQWERTRDGDGPTLGEVCRLLGFLREDQVNAIVRAQQKSEIMLEDSLTGKICLKNKLLSSAQLEEALEDQRALDYTTRLGDLLCERGYIDRQQLHAVLKAQTRMKSGRLKPSIMPPERPAATATAATATATATVAPSKAKASPATKAAGKAPAATKARKTAKKKK